MSPAPCVVLVADDHADTRAVLKAILESRGWRVLEARDGLECLRLARAERPAVLVLDLLMPGLDGWRVAQALKSDPATSGIHIVALTASIFPDDHLRALAAGCAEVLTKPVRPQRVLVEVEAVCRGAGA
jgi:CheY-like chemotaxis protein